MATVRLPEIRRKYTVYRGRVIFAARVIMRAWMNFKFGKRFQMLMDKHRQKIYQERVERAFQVCLWPAWECV